MVGKTVLPGGKRPEVRSKNNKELAEKGKKTLPEPDILSISAH
jgi:hypothetical protein